MRMLTSVNTIVIVDINDSFTFQMSHHKYGKNLIE